MAAAAAQIAPCLTNTLSGKKTFFLNKEISRTGIFNMHLLVSRSYQYRLLDINITVTDSALLDDMGIR